MTETSFPDFELLPAGTDEATADDELAILAEIADPESLIDPVEVDEQAPLGKTWAFDHVANAVLTYGGGQQAIAVHGIDTVIQWCLMALRVQRFLWPLFSDQFGREDPDAALGFADDAEYRAQIRRDVQDTLLVHDRITDVRDFSWSVDPLDEEALLMSCTVVLDDALEASLLDVNLRRG